MKKTNINFVINSLPSGPQIKIDWLYFKETFFLFSQPNFFIEKKSFHCF